MEQAQEMTAPESSTRTALLEATGRCIQAFGYAGLTTRRVAEQAGVPLSQIHYHFGSKQKLVLALLEHENGKLLARQRATFAEAIPLSERWDRACDYLDQDLDSGYVRVLNEIVAAGYADPELAAEARRIFESWNAVIRGLTAEAEATLGPLGPFSSQEVATLVGMAFIGAEHLLLVGAESEARPIRRALRKVGELVRMAEAAWK